jgi:hypothetical protein
VLNWRQGDTIPLSRERTLRVLGVRDDDGDQPPGLVVEDLPGSATSAAGWRSLGSFQGRVTLDRHRPRDACGLAPHFLPLFLPT